MIISEYRRHIPDCCALRDYALHYVLLGGCWALVTAIKEGAQTPCQQCQYCRAERQA